MLKSYCVYELNSMISNQKLFALEMKCSVTSKSNKKVFTNTLSNEKLVLALKFITIFSFFTTK